jgi:hypothetical protein
MTYLGRRRPAHSFGHRAECRPEANSCTSPFGRRGGTVLACPGLFTLQVSIRDLVIRYGREEHAFEEGDQALKPSPLNTSVTLRSKAEEVRKPLVVCGYQRSLYDTFMLATLVRPVPTPNKG